MLPIHALSIRTCATRLPPSSATAMFIAWPTSLAFFSAALITRRASSNFMADIKSLLLLWLATDLADVMTQTIFHMTRLVKSLFYQFLDPTLGGWPHNRGEAHLPLRCDLKVGRQAVHIDKALGLPDRPLIEGCNAVF